MDKLAILALLEAKPGKEPEVEEFLKSALPMAQAETGTTSWYAFKIGPSNSVSSIHLPMRRDAMHTFLATSRKPCSQRLRNFLQNRPRSTSQKFWP